LQIMLWGDVSNWQLLHLPVLFWHYLSGGIVVINRPGVSPLRWLVLAGWPVVGCPASLSLECVKRHLVQRVVFVMSQDKWGAAHVVMMFTMTSACWCSLFQRRALFTLIWSAAHRVGQEP
jgi:hypothetical protein